MSVSIKPSAAIRSFLARGHRLLIGGNWVPARSGATFTTFNPATGQALSVLASADAVDVDLAVAGWSSASETQRS